MKTLKALGLLETLLALTIIAILLLVSVRYYASTQTNNKINATVLLSQNLHAAMTKCLRAQDSCSSIDDLIRLNYLPANAKQSPWQSNASNSVSLKTYNTASQVSSVCGGSKTQLNAGIYILVTIGGLPANTACCHAALRLQGSTAFADCNSEKNKVQSYFLYS